ncbi:hypothetical protein CL658_00055 [bacterium]|nr:hypothetical protein [bacterium]|tara:strand:+ start:3280 stop:3783 length:504 start_codon:yes stop_codon:yes gene_type:complete
MPLGKTSSYTQLPNAHNNAHRGTENNRGRYGDAIKNHTVILYKKDKEILWMIYQSIDRYLRTKTKETLDSQDVLDASIKKIVESLVSCNKNLSDSDRDMHDNILQDLNKLVSFFKDQSDIRDLLCRQEDEQILFSTGLNPPKLIQDIQAMDTTTKQELIKECENLIK